MKLFVVSLLFGLIAFLAVFMIFIAAGARDGHATSTTRRERSRPDPASLSQGPPRTPNVDPDCYGDGELCRKERLGEIVAMTNMLVPTMEAAGWPSGCFELMLVGGDAGELDAISISVAGRPKLGSARCNEPDSGGATKSQLSRLGAKIKALLGDTVEGWRVDLLQITDGLNADVQIKLK